MFLPVFWRSVVGEGLADVSQTGRFVGAAGEGQRDVRAVVGAGRRDGARNGAGRDQQDTGGQQRGGAQAGPAQAA